MSAHVATIRAAILAKLQAVPGIGLVYDRERYAKEESQFRKLYTLGVEINGEDTDVLHGWWFRRTQSLERSLGVGRNLDISTWTIRGYLGFDDARNTEHEFEALIEAMRDAFRADPTLGGAAEQSPLRDSNNQDGLQLAETSPVWLAGALCHSAVLTLTTWSYL